MTVAGVRDGKRGRAALRILVYYIALLGALALLIWRFPGFLDLVLMEQPPVPLGTGEITSTFSADVPAASPVPEGWSSIWVTTVAVDAMKVTVKAVKDGAPA